MDETLSELLVETRDLLEWPALPIGTVRQYGPHLYIKTKAKAGAKAWRYYAKAGSAKGEKALAKLHKRKQNPVPPATSRRKHPPTPAPKTRVKPATKPRSQPAPKVASKPTPRKAVSAALAVSRARKRAGAPPPPKRKAVSAAFDIGPTPEGASHDGAKTAKRVLDLIDSVHSDGVLPKIKIHLAAVDGQHGEYTHQGKTAKHINLNPSGDHGLLTLSHEIGHFLDHQGISQKLGLDSFGSEAKHPAFKKFRVALKRTAAYRTLRQRMKKAEQKQSKNARYYAYLLRPREVFARAYAQWIAHKTGDGEMRKMLDRERARKAGVKYNPRQWDDDDFAPLAKAMDHLFGELGWLRGKTPKSPVKHEAADPALERLMALIDAGSRGKSPIWQPPISPT